MKLTDKQRAVLARLRERGVSTLLTGGECVSVRSLKARGLVIYDGLNHYRITEAGKAALEGGE